MPLMSFRFQVDYFIIDNGQSYCDRLRSSRDAVNRHQEPSKMRPSNGKIRPLEK